MRMGADVNAFVLYNFSIIGDGLILLSDKAKTGIKIITGDVRDNNRSEMQ